MVDTVEAFFILLFPPQYREVKLSVTGSEASGGGSAAAVGFVVYTQPVVTVWGPSFRLG